MSQEMAITLEVMFQLTDFDPSSSITLHIKSTDTAGQALAEYYNALEQRYLLEPGTLKNAAARAVPYRPALSGPNASGPFFLASWRGGKADNSIGSSSRHVAQPAPENMLMGHIFGTEGGNYLIDVDSDLSKLVPAKSEYSVLTHTQNVI